MCEKTRANQLIALRGEKPWGAAGDSWAGLDDGDLIMTSGLPVNDGEISCLLAFLSF